MPRSHSPGRALTIAAALVSATFIALTFTGIAQIISLHECDQGFTAELQFDSTPAVLCRNGSTALELPIAPSVATIVFAIAGAAVSLWITVRTARGARAAA